MKAAAFVGFVVCNKRLFSVHVAELIISNSAHSTGEREMFSILPLLRTFTLLFLTSIVGISNLALADVKAKTEILVGAAASLKDVFEEMAAPYEKENPSVKVTFQFAASGALQQQIEQGAPFDVFVSAAQKQVDALLQKDLLVKDSVEKLFENSLVLIVPKGKKGPNTLDELNGPAFKRIAIGEKQTVPAGQYAEQWLEKNKLLAPLKDRLIPASNVRQVLTFVETGNADAGFVYKTDALSSKSVEIVLQADTSQHDPIVYPLALVKKSKHLEAAKNFASFLKSNAARQILLKHGFKLPEKAK